MARIRKLVLAITAASALSTGVAHALGLGEISLQSALNQPLVAEIELLDINGLSAGEIMPSLASAEDFQRAGVDRPLFLNDLRFTPVVNAQGKSVIRISSSKPVREPYLNFLVEVYWPSGRALREYTVLLDPPLYNPQFTADVAPQLAQAAPQAPQPQAQPQAQVPPQPQAQPQLYPPRSEPLPPRAPRVRPAAATQPAEQTQYRTVAHDTLWEIAMRHRRGNASIQQTMLAIQDLNPGAFLDDNINLLKAGQVLRLPDEQQIASRSRTEALARGAEQDAAWQAWRQARGLAAGDRRLDPTRRTAAAALSDSIILLTAGQALRLPDEQQIASRSRTEAIARVAEQNAAWQAWRQARALAAGERQLDATGRTAAGAAPERVDIGDSLRLVAGTDGRVAEGEDSGSTDASVLADRLAVAQENLDTSRRASAELESRMGDLQSQLDKLQRLIELK